MLKTVRLSSQEDFSPITIVTVPDGKYWYIQTVEFRTLSFGTPDPAPDLSEALWINPYTAEGSNIPLFSTVGTVKEIDYGVAATALGGTIVGYQWEGYRFLPANQTIGYYDVYPIPLQTQWQAAITYFEFDNN